MAVEAAEKQTNEQAGAVLEQVTEENQGVSPEQTSEAPQYTEIEQAAMKKGWKPKDQYDGEDWRSAREFMERGEFMETIHQLKRKVKDQENTLSNVQKLMEMQVKHVREQTIKELNQQRREAIQNGDVATVEMLDREMDRRKQEFEPVDAKPAIPEEAREWARKNSGWFNQNTAENKLMFQFMIDKEEEIHQQNPGIDAMEALRRAEDAVKQRFPERFQNPAQNRKSEVESNTPGTGNRRKTYNPSNITPEMRKLARDFVRNRVFQNEEAYYQELYKLGELK